MKLSVVAANPDWPQQFAIEATAIHSSLGAVVQNIQHIGSTAVPELAAKPIIDILLEVSSLIALDALFSKLEGLGYQTMGEFGIAGRRYFRKGEHVRTHQVHAYEIGDANLLRHLAFRDYMREFAAAREAYAALKLQLLQTCHDDADLYCQRKDSFVKFHEAQALQWYSQLQKSI